MEAMGVVEMARFLNGQMRFITDFNQFSAERDDRAHERLLIAAKRLPDRHPRRAVVHAPEPTFGVLTGVELGRQLFQKCEEVVGNCSQPPRVDS